MFNTISTIGLVANKDLAEWKADRKLFNAIFSTKEIAENINFQNFTEKLKSKIDTNENAPLDIHGIINRWAISVVIDYLTNDHLDENTTDKFISAVDIVLKLTVERSFSPLKFYDWSYKFTKDYDITTKSASYINKVARDIIQKQTEIRKNRKGVRNDFMDTILSKNYNEQFKQDHLKTFIIAGYETVSSTVSFALFEIAKKPNIQNKILKEYLDIVGTNDSNITSFDIKSMKYTELVLKETMRMYTPAPMVQRTLKSPVTVEKFTIPSNIDLIFSISALHQLNFPNPNEFDPDRFSFENIKNINAYAYTPFSLGPRDCIGRRLAMIEMKYLLSYIVKNFTLHPVEPEHKLDLALDLGLKSKNGVPIIFKKRII
nr:cytochrome P450 3A19-like [Onthophagus taurus]